MSKPLKSFIITLFISIALAGLTLCLYLLDPEFETSFYCISSMILVTIWALFVIPSLIYGFIWVKNYFKTLTFEQGFRLGYLFGRGWGVLAFILLLIVSPVTGIIWYVQTIKKHKLVKQLKRDIIVE